MLTMKLLYLTINSRKAVSTIAQSHPYNDFRIRYAVKMAFGDVFIAISRADLSVKLYPHPYIKISVEKAFLFREGPAAYPTPLLLQPGFDFLKAFV